MAIMNETVLYYNPDKSDSKAALVKGVLVRMGVRIKNISPDQVTQTVGFLIGDKAFSLLEAEENLPEVKEEILIMHHFTGKRIDELLYQLRKSGVPKIDLKAVVTDSNRGWTFYHLYEEIKEEHESMKQQ